MSNLFCPNYQHRGCASNIQLVHITAYETPSVLFNYDKSSKPLEVRVGISQDEAAELWKGAKAFASS